MTVAQMMAKIHVFIEGYNSFNLDAMLSVLDPGIVFINTTGGVTTVETRGIESFRQLAEQSLPAFSSRCQRISDYSEINGGIEVSIDYEAVAAIDLPGGIKAGDKLSLQGRSVYLFNGESISFIEDLT